ncbi:hypothetical protein M6B38_313605 [Iris pallida]|uniref:Uncharacterized protein n=1 Tax=Iris pallida TaxID=29817 RepID=A0AAX6HGP6_IRIPA|nr:hypothetical protein M6B38_313605 [Iris pallida]
MGMLVRTGRDMGRSGCSCPVCVSGYGVSSVHITMLSCLTKGACPDKWSCPGCQFAVFSV